MKFSKKLFLQLLFILYALLLVWDAIFSMQQMDMLYEIKRYGSDWLINYEGGFVRRGLVG